METWYIYAVLSAVFAGLYSLLSKSSAFLNHNSSLVTAWSMLIAALLSFTISDYGNTINYGSLPALLGVSLLNGVLYLIVVITRIESLRYINTTLYFPIYKTIGPIIVTLISLTYFGEALDSSDKFGVMLGVIVPLILITKGEAKSNSEIKRGVILLIIGAVASAFTACIPKFAIETKLQLDFTIAFSLTFGAVASLALYLKSIKNKKNESFNKDGVMLYSLMGGVTMFLSWQFFGHATKGNLAIAYTINSFSIAITVLLAVLIYREQINSRKIIALILSISAIIFFK